MTYPPDDIPKEVHEHYEREAERLGLVSSPPSACSAAPDECLGEHDRYGDFDCRHKYADEITCEECKHGPCAEHETSGLLDPRYPRDCQPKKEGLGRSFELPDANQVAERLCKEAEALGLCHPTETMIAECLHDFEWNALTNQDAAWKHHDGKPDWMKEIDPDKK